MRLEMKIYLQNITKTTQNYPYLAVMFFFQAMHNSNLSSCKPLHMDFLAPSPEQHSTANN